MTRSARFVHRPPSSPLPLGIGIGVAFFADEDTVKEYRGGDCCCGVASTTNPSESPSATLCAIPGWYTVPVDCPSMVDVAPNTRLPPMAPPRRRTATICNLCGARSYSHSRSVLAPATVMSRGRGVWSSAVRRAERSAMHERYSEPVRSARIHSGCIALIDMKDISIFPSFDIGRASGTFVGAPNCACARRGESLQAELR